MRRLAPFSIPRIEEWNPDRAWRAINLLLALVFGSCLLLLAAATWLASDLLWVPIVALSSGVLLVHLGRSELGMLTAILFGFIAVVGHKEGFQPEEALYGMVYLGYLAYWFASRLFFYRDDILATSVDRALFLFLVWVTASFALTALFHGNPASMLSEWLSVSMLAFYFPVKELCVKEERAPRFIVGALFSIAVFAVLRNFLAYRSGLSNATALWQIATSRVVENEHVLLMMGLVALVLVLFSTRTWSRAVALLTFLLFVSGVIIGQSRAVWISFVLGGLVILVLIDRRRRLQLVGYGLSSVVIALLVGLLVFPEFYVLIVAGLADRFYSLGSAVTSDLSLVNRFEEMGAAWKYIRLNPIVGYGFGVPIEYYSLVYELSYRTSFIHNGPIGVWYRHGLIGFGLIYFYYFASLMRGVRLSRHGAGFYKVLGIAVAACFTAEALLGNSENPFATSDKTLFIGVLAGLVAAGVARMEPPSSG